MLDVNLIRMSMSTMVNQIFDFDETNKMKRSFQAFTSSEKHLLALDRAHRNGPQAP